MNGPFKALLAKLAPTILTAVGGPLGAVAGTLIRAKLGGEPAQDIGDVIEAATTTPEGLEKIKLAEADLKKFELDNGLKFAELDVDDRKSARDLGAKTSLVPQMTLSALFVGGYFTILGLFFANELRVPMNEAFMVMLGVLTAGVPQILNFWMGSSHSSQGKTDVLAAALAKQTG